MYGVIIATAAKFPNVHRFYYLVHLSRKFLYAVEIFLNASQPRRHDNQTDVQQWERMPKTVALCEAIIDSTKRRGDYAREEERDFWSPDLTRENKMLDVARGGGERKGSENDKPSGLKY